MKTIDKLKSNFPQSIISTGSCLGQDYVLVKPQDLLKIALFIKDELGFEFLMDLTCVDYKGYPKREESWRFEVVYQFYSFKNKERLRVKIPVEEDSLNVPSLVPLWLSANWYEREVYDMYGIHFDGHPDLRRILMYDEFKGHPLRKDYPLKGRQPRILERK